MQWKNEAKTYLDQELMFAQHPNPIGKWTGGNMLKDLGVFYIMAALKGQIEPSDRDNFIQAVTNCYVPGYPGLLNRNKDREDQQSHDDYISVVCASVFLDTDIAKTIRDNNKFYRDNKKDGKFYFGGIFARFFYLRPLFNLCADKKVGLLDKAIIWIYFNLVRPEDESEFILYWCMAQVCKLFNVCKSSAVAWEQRLNSKQQFTSYYKEEHVFSKFFL